MNDKYKRIIINISKYILQYIIVSIIVGLFASYAIQHITKDKWEVTFKLDTWVTINPDEFTDIPNDSTHIPNMYLMLVKYKDTLIDTLISEDIDTVKVEKPILKVTWWIINTGNKCIEEYENKPKIEFPKEYKYSHAFISDKSNDLKISNNLSKVKNTNEIEIDGLGLFNPEEYIKINIFLTKVDENDSISKSFAGWELKIRSGDLIIEKDVSTALETRLMKSKDDSNLSSFFDIGNALISLILIIFLNISLIKFKLTLERNKNKRNQ